MSCMYALDVCVVIVLFFLNDIVVVIVIYDKLIDCVSCASRWSLSDAVTEARLRNKEFEYSVLVSNVNKYHGKGHILAFLSSSLT
jgi:hypothetical protein